MIKIICVVLTRTKMGWLTFCLSFRNQKIWTKWKKQCQSFLSWHFPLKQPVLSRFPICTSFFSIQQNKTLSGNNWAGSKRGLNFILGGLIPTKWSAACGYRSIVRHGECAVYELICLEHLWVMQWGKERVCFIPAYSLDESLPEIEN